MRERKILRSSLIGSLAILGTLGLRAAECPPQTYTDYRKNPIYFPQGACSFADVVIDYRLPEGTRCRPTNSKFLDPGKAIGIPDYTGGSNGVGAVSLGEGGSITLGFTNNVLTNSGDAGPDVYVYEVGPNTEGMIFYVRPADAGTRERLAALIDPDGFILVGEIRGNLSQTDLDAVFRGFAPGELRFDAVRIIDIQGTCSGDDTGGADIDAVGAISTEPTADLSAAIEASPDPVTVGDVLTYRVTAANLGAGPAVGARLSVVLPEGLENVSASSSTGAACTVAGGRVSCELGTLESGASAVITIHGTPGREGTLECVATVSGDSADLVPGNDEARITTTAAWDDPLENALRLVVREMVDGTLEVDVLLTNALVVQGLNFGICHDPALLEGVAFEAAPVWAGGPPDFKFATFDPFTGNCPDCAAGFVAALVGDQVSDVRNIEPGKDRRIGTIRFAVRSGASGCTTLRFVECLSGARGSPVVKSLLVCDDRSVVPATEDATFCFDPRPGGFSRGRCNADDRFDISDPVFLLEYLFLGGSRPTCLDACDANDDGKLNITDPIALLAYLFQGASALPPPFPGCGEDPTPDDLGCEASNCP
jgi:uncharacterized repeat protein (TIGR01451 family)